MPSFITDACLKLKDDIQSVNEIKEDSLGFLLALNSEENMSKVVPNSIEIFQTSEGRAVTVYKKSYQRIEPEDVRVGLPADYCVAGSHPDKFQREITFDKVADKLDVKITIADAEMRKYCKDESKAQLIKARIKSAMHALMGRLERKLTADFLLQRGNLVGGGTVVTGDLFRANQPVRDFGSFIDNALFQKDEMELSGKLIAVGGGLMQRYASITQSGVVCCNEQGFNQENALDTADILFYRSPNVRTALGSNPNDVPMWGAGSVIPVYWGKYWGDFDTMSSTQQRNLNEYQGFDTHVWGYVGNSNVRIPFDLSMRFNNCGEDSVWIVTVATYAKLDMDTPTETFSASSRLFGTNGAFLGRPTAS